MSESFRIGDRVRIPHSGWTASGTIVEDRGAIGDGGRQFYGVLVANDPEDPESHEYAAEELQPFAGEPPFGPADAPRLVRYLKHGGLVSILHANLAGGKYQPRVWLCRDTLGNITHTFYEERGLVGGRTVPLFALRGERVFAPMRDQIVDYVESFGLSRADAEAVMRAVGVRA